MKCKVTYSSVQTNFLEELKSYFERYGFRYRETEEGLEFFKNTGILSGWYTNPLNFESQLLFTFDENQCVAQVSIDSGSTIFTKEALACWEVFLKDIGCVLRGQTENKALVEEAIHKAKNSIRFSHIYVVAGMILGGLTGQTIYSFTGSYYFIYLGLLIGSVIGFKWNVVERETARNFDF